MISLKYTFVTWVGLAVSEMLQWWGINSHCGNFSFGEMCLGSYFANRVFLERIRKSALSTCRQSWENASISEPGKCKVAKGLQQRKVELVSVHIVERLRVREKGRRALSIRLIRQRLFTEQLTLNFQGCIFYFLCSDVLLPVFWFSSQNDAKHQRDKAQRIKAEPTRAKLDAGYF